MPMPPAERIALTCVSCGAGFERPSHRRVRGNVYCSRQCYYEGLRKHPDELRAKKQARARRWREANVDRVKAYRRAQSLKMAYGISVADYEALEKAQDGRCAICGEVPKRMCVDHDHATGAVRGLLCDPCNVGLGSFRDKPDILDAAKSYLLR